VVSPHAADALGEGSVVGNPSVYAEDEVNENPLFDPNFSIEIDSC